MQGILYIVATPIGNLQDFSPRAQSILREANLILAEDTRHSRRLLDHFHITTPLDSLHAHNEKQSTNALLSRLRSGNMIALISDAGTPLISDPGHYLVAAAHEQRIPIIPIPGPSALIAALSVAGLTADHFVFEGFLPAKPSARRQRLEALEQESRTLVFYEAPHRIIESLTDLVSIFGQERTVILAKELTKLFETIYRNQAQEVLRWLTDEPERQKGEFVLVVQGASPPAPDELDAETKRIFLILHKELPLKQAAKLTSEITGVSKNALYDFGLHQ